MGIQALGSMPHPSPLRQVSFKGRAVFEDAPAEENNEGEELVVVVDENTVMASMPTFSPVKRSTARAPGHMTIAGSSDRPPVDTARVAMHNEQLPMSPLLLHVDFATSGAMDSHRLQRDANAPLAKTTARTPRVTELAAGGGSLPRQSSKVGG